MGTLPCCIAYHVHPRTCVPCQLVGSPSPPFSFGRSLSLHTHTHKQTNHARREEARKCSFSLFCVRCAVLLFVETPPFSSFSLLLLLPFSSLVFLPFSSSFCLSSRTRQRRGKGRRTHTREGNGDGAQRKNQTLDKI